MTNGEAFASSGEAKFSHVSMRNVMAHFMYASNILFNNEKKAQILNLP
jgi:hypothetical protein